MQTYSALVPPWRHSVFVTLLPFPIIIPIAVFSLFCPQILKGVLDGVSHLLPVLRILSSLLSSCNDSVLLYSFCQEAGLPELPLSLLRYSQESSSIQQVYSPAASEDKGWSFSLAPFLGLLSLAALSWSCKSV